MQFIRALPHDTHDLLASCEPKGQRFWYESPWTVHYCGQDYMGIPIGDRFVVKLTSSIAAPIGNERLDRFFRDMIAMLAQYPECYSGHVECGPFFEVHAGNYYEVSFALHSMTFDRELNHFAFWDESTDRTRLARGIYMGNYFGPALNKRIDPDGSFAEAFRKHRAYPVPPFPDVPPLHYVDEFPNGGAYYALTKLPLRMSKQYQDQRDEEPARLGMFLRKQLREKGAIL